MDNALRWGTFLFLILSALLQATWFFGGKGKRETTDVLALDIDDLKDEDKAIRKRIHDLVDFWETRFVGKEVAEAKWADFQGQMNRFGEELKRLQTDINRGRVH